MIKRISTAPMIPPAIAPVFFELLAPAPVAEPNELPLGSATVSVLDAEVVGIEVTVIVTGVTVLVVLDVDALFEVDDDEEDEPEVDVDVFGSDPPDGMSTR